MYVIENMQETLLEYIIQLSFAVHCKTWVEELTRNNCWGCQHDRPSQKEHDCLMLVGMDPWFAYFEEALKRLDQGQVIQCAQNVAAEFGLTLPDSESKTYFIQLKHWPIERFYMLVFKMEQTHTAQGRFKAILQAASSFSPKSEPNVM